MAMNGRLEELPGAEEGKGELFGKSMAWQLPNVTVVRISGGGASACGFGSKMR